MDFLTPDEFQAFLDIVKGTYTTSQLAALAEKLKGPTDQLNKVLESNGVKVMTPQKMVGANPGLEQLRAQVESTNGVLQSATTFITGVPTLIQAAVQQAMANGATAEELQPVLDLGNQLQQNASALADAVAANNPQG